MNDNTDKTRVSRHAWLLTCAVGVVLGMSACGSGGSGGSAGGNNPGSTSTPSSTSSQATRYQHVLAFSQCMRSNGVPDFPDPNADGVISLAGIASKLNGAAVQSAEQACRHLLPNGGRLTPAQQQTALNVLLKFSECMRAHGVLNYPDPSLVNGAITIDLQGTGISNATPHILSAYADCKPLLTPKQA